LKEPSTYISGRKTKGNGSAVKEKGGKCVGRDNQVRTGGQLKGKRKVNFLCGINKGEDGQKVVGTNEKSPIGREKKEG